MKYCCEECGKTFTKEEEAIACEKKHKEEQTKRETLAKEQANRWAEVEKAKKAYFDLYDKYYKDYPMSRSIYPKETTLEDLIDRVVFRTL